MATHRMAPTWLVGLSNAPFGFNNGLIFYALPQLLAARHVPEQRIAGLTGVLVLPLILTVLIAPVLDVRFSRRFYAVVCCTLATGLSVSALLTQDNFPLFGTLLFFSMLSTGLFSAALGGWQASVIATARQPTLSAFYNIANIGAGGAMAAVAVPMIRSLPLPAACAVFACMMLLPMVVFLFMPAPGPDRRLARESFAGLLRAIASLFGRGEVLLVLALFLLPSSSFTMTNILSALGADYHTPERTVSLLNGAGVTFAGIFCCLVAGVLCRRLPLRRLYLGIGIVGGLFTLSLAVLPHVTFVYGLATVGENALQALAFTAMTAISLRTVGHGNALAATEMSILTASANVPLFYMQFIDSHAYKVHGLAGAYVTDAAISIVVCVGLLGFMWRVRARLRQVAAVPA